MTTSDNAVELQNATRSYIAKISWDCPVAVNLTLKQRVRQKRIDLCIASTNFRHFMNRLNRVAFGNAVKRFGHRLQVITVTELSHSNRLHHHAVIGRPDHIEFEQFKAHIEDCWRKTYWGYRETVVVPMTNFGWVSYITKLDQKPEFDLAIDWMNAHALKPT